MTRTKVEFVAAHWQRQTTIREKKSLFKREVVSTEEIKTLKGKVDFQRLSNDLNNKISELENDGFEIVNTTPIASGEYDFKSDRDYSLNNSYGWGYGWGYGFGYTSGILIQARK